MSASLDETDRKILSLLQAEDGVTKAEIARRLRLAQSVVSDRVRRMETRGVICGYVPRLDATAMGYAVLAYVFVKERKPTGNIDTGKLLARVPGVEEVHKIAGEDCFLIKIRARNANELAAVLDTRINPIETIEGTRTTIVLRTVREDPPLAGVDLLNN